MKYIYLSIKIQDQYQNEMTSGYRRNIRAEVRSIRDEIWNERYLLRKSREIEDQEDHGRWILLRKLLLSFGARES
jgi:hypothetical protein